ncbi:MAG: hypothetical protein AAF333_19460 [Planctomycetota bacterium]
MRSKVWIGAAAVALGGLGVPGAQAQVRNESAKFVSNDPEMSRLFGWSVAIVNDIAVIGAPAETPDGAAYIFNTEGDLQLSKVTTLLNENDDNLAGSVAIGGSTAVVGLPDRENGAAYLFNVDAVSGTQIIRLIDPTGARGDRFGHSVGISGNTVIVGAPRDDDNGTDSGSAFLFNTDGGLIAKITPDNAVTGARFGWSVDISGNTAIVGARTAVNDDGSVTGLAYLFNASEGNQIRTLEANDASQNDRFGHSVGISGNTAVVGAEADDDNGMDSGSAYLFDVTDGRQMFKLTADDGAPVDVFGSAVAIDGDAVVVGAFGHDGNGSNSGAAYLFNAINGRQVARLTALDNFNADFFGRSVAVSGDTAIIGAPQADVGDNNVSGAAYCFDASLPDVTIIEGDYNGDGVVGMADQDLVLLNFGATTLPSGYVEAALPGGFFDGIIGFNELSGVLDNFGNTAP